MNPLGQISPEQFLREYWQKKPLLIRNAFPGFNCPITPDELAGLALEDEIESRIITTEPDTWSLRRGPFSEQDFSQLPEQDWTLLVQAVDHWVPEVGELLEPFRFLPDWRLDDIMISYAAPGGSVGPHFDQYDVFLIQGYGTRRWQLGQQCDESSPLRSHPDLKILTEFTTSADYLMQPGDMLYLPPGLAHYGVAVDECMTLSVGFRAPTHSDIIGHFCDFIGSRLDQNLRYSDPDLQLASNPAELSDQAIYKVQEIIQQHLSQPAMIAEWFGRYMTEPKYPELQPEATSIELPQPGTEVFVTEGSRLAWHQGEQGLWLFADGASLKLPATLQRRIMQLCEQRQLCLQSDDDKSLIETVHRLLEQGALYLEEELDEEVEI